MQVKSLGHVVLKVRDLERSVGFYKDILGLEEVARLPKYRMAFFSIAGNHHDIALVETEADAPAAPKQAPGLAHVALKIGDSLEELREAKRWLDQNGIEIDHTSDHKVSKSIYFHDPDGN
jgi:catechol 2,3-dioxygenase